jgi:hypothetical protein
MTLLRKGYLCPCLNRLICTTLLLFEPILASGLQTSETSQNSVAPQGSEATKVDRSELVKQLDRLVEQNEKLQQQNHELIEQIRAMRNSLTNSSEPQPAPLSTPADGSSADSQQRPPDPNLDEAAAAQSGRRPAAEVATPEKPQQWGTYTPNFGYKLANTKHGDLNLSIFTYVRYINQRALDDSFTDSFGNVKGVQQRQDVELNKLQIKFLGWLLTPKLRYFLYAWTNNANQGGSFYIALAGYTGFNFNKHFSLWGGLNGLPGTRSIEGNFPFWLGVDNRHIADEFFRPSYTSGIWAKGHIIDKLRYHVMVGNNLSTLGVTAAQFNKKFNTFASALVWEPTTGEFGPGFGDYENHQKLATRLGVHFTRSDENRESQPNTDAFENTQIRLSDGNIIFTPNLFAPGVTVTDLRYRMASIDGGFKYRGKSLEGEYFMRWLDKFQGPGTETVPDQFDHGFQMQASAMLVPNQLQLYTGGSMIFGQHGDAFDTRIGANWFPFKNRVVRWNNEALYLNKSPAGYTAVPFPIGGTGWVFHSNFEVAF